MSICFYSLMYWKLLDGLPVLSTKSEISEQIQLQLEFYLATSASDHACKMSSVEKALLATFTPHIAYKRDKLFSQIEVLLYTLGP